jgi:hypothetical protein
MNRYKYFLEQLDKELQEVVKPRNLFEGSDVSELETFFSVESDLTDNEVLEVLDYFEEDFKEAEMYYHCAMIMKIKDKYNG